MHCLGKSGEGIINTLLYSITTEETEVITVKHPSGFTVVRLAIPSMNMLNQSLADLQTRQRNCVWSSIHYLYWLMHIECKVWWIQTTQGGGHKQSNSFIHSFNLYLNFEESFSMMSRDIETHTRQTGRIEGNLLKAMVKSRLTGWQ